MQTIKDINEFRQQTRLFNLTENEIKSDFEKQSVKKKRKIKNNDISKNITFEQYKSSICNFLFQVTEEDLLKGFRNLQINFKYQEIKRNIKSANRKRDFNLIAKYESDLDNLVNVKVKN